MGLASLGVGRSSVRHPWGQPSRRPYPFPSHSRVEAQFALVPGGLAAPVLAAGRGTVPRHGGAARAGPEPSTRRRGRGGAGVTGTTATPSAPPSAGSCSRAVRVRGVTCVRAANGAALRVGIAVAALRGEGPRERWRRLGGSGALRGSGSGAGGRE